MCWDSLLAFQMCWSFCLLVRCRGAVGKYLCFRVFVWLYLGVFWRVPRLCMEFCFRVLAVSLRIGRVFFVSWSSFAILNGLDMRLLYMV